LVVYSSLNLIFLPLSPKDVFFTALKSKHFFINLFINLFFNLSFNSRYIVDNQSNYSVNDLGGKVPTKCLQIAWLCEDLDKRYLPDAVTKKISRPSERLYYSQFSEFAIGRLSLSDVHWNPER